MSAWLIFLLGMGAGYILSLLVGVLVIILCACLAQNTHSWPELDAGAFSKDLDAWIAGVEADLNSD